MSPELDLRSGQALELNEAEKTALETALALWTSTSRNTFSIPVAVLRNMLTHNDAGAQTAAMVPDEGVLEAEHITVTPEQMAKLDPDEKFGLLLGEGIFIANTVPEEYVPLLVLNLTIHRHLRDDSRVVQLFKETGGDTAKARHWSANIVDVLAAERQFGDAPEKLRAYLEWRKRTERTEFFNNELVAPHFDRYLSAHEYRRTTHPSERGRFAAASWGMAGIAARMPGTDRLFLDLGASIVDVAFRKIIQEPNFDPGKMMQLLDYIAEHTQEVKIGRRRVLRAINLQERPDLQQQAYLLTEDVSGGGALLLQDDFTHSMGPEVYETKIQVQQSIRPLRDRLAYFNREAIMRHVPDLQIGSALMRLFKHTESVSIGGLADTTMDVDLRQLAQLEQAMDWLESQIEAITVELSKVDGLLQRYDEVVSRFQSTAGNVPDVNIVPRSILDEQRELAEHRTALLLKRGELEQKKDLMGVVRDVRSNQRALLSETVLGPQKTLPSRGRS